MQRTPGMNDVEFFEWVTKLAANSKQFALATVVKTEGSTLAKPGFKILVDEEGNVVSGTLGGGCPEGPIVELALEAIKRKTPKLVRIHLVDAGKSLSEACATAKSDDDELYVETNCGGNMEIFIDPYTKRDRLIVISDGGRDDVANWVVALASQLGFEVHAIDPTGMVKGADEVHQVDDPAQFDFKQGDYVVAVTRGRLDVPALEALSKTKCRFVGFMASKQRINDVFMKLRARGVNEEFLSSVHAPVGADIGGTTPQEIALSILADVVAVKRGKHVPHKS
ncbi:MAG: XdhC family protein [Thermoprotei archaeon]